MRQFEGTHVTQTSQPGGGTGDLSTKLLPELRSIGAALGIKGARTMRKADLVAAIRAAGGHGEARGAEGSGQPARQGRAASTRRSAQSGDREEGSADDGRPADGTPDAEAGQSPRRRARNQARESSRRHEDTRPDEEETSQGGRQRSRREERRPDERSSRRGEDSSRRDDHGEPRSAGSGHGGDVSDEVGARLEALTQAAAQARGSQGGRGLQEGRGSQDARGSQGEDSDRDDRSSSREDEDYGQGSRRSRRRRQRDRQNRRNKRGNDRGNHDSEPNVREDDVLVPCSGILDIRDQYAFVRTSGYLPGPNDAYVAMSMVRRHGLRKGDVVVGQMRAHREGERREKFAPLVRIEQVNGADPEQMRQRPEFSRLTPLYPQQRLRLETADPRNLTGRIIDLVSPIGKGQRGLIVSPPKAGKTMIMQSIANSIAANNPEVHLMVVLVDERPEEVTDFQRTVSGEVIASTFDRPADDHTQLSELAIERAKRLVELGHDVVVLLDGITRLGRAYNLAAPASGRILSGGVDSAALYPPKKFFGAARNIEDGGSLTILATALVETGSKMDEVIFEEFKGTGNMELRLRREFANKRLFPAIDVDASGTRREELLLSREETAIMWKLRRVLSGLGDSQALEMLLGKLRKTQTNAEFLFTISKTTPSSD